MGHTRLAAGVAMITVALGGARANAQTATAASITKISVCGAGTQTSASCPAGTFDTQQVVLAAGTNGVPLNEWNVPTTTDEHSSVFPPYSLGSNTNYIFFVAAGTVPPSALPGTSLEHGADIGDVVLSGRPDKHGQWRLGFEPGYAPLDINGNPGPLFLAPTGQNRCPTLSDSTFDLNYAASGSVVPNPSGPAGSLLMVYEGANICNSAGRAPIMLGIATSADFGRSWPTYAAAPDFTFAPLPYQNVDQGPNVSNAGAFGSAVCVGNGCTVATPYSGYGRYPVITPPVGPDTRDAQPAAFVDDVQGGSPTYLYTVEDYNPTDTLLDGRAFDITIARAALNGGSGPLHFEKWNGQACGADAPCWVGPSPGVTLNAAEEYPILKDGDFSACGDPLTQERSSPSISYFATTGQYILTFVCKSPGDPAVGPYTDSAASGAAWFFSTSPDLSDPNQWSTPVEILGTWNPFPVDGLYNGWYPTFMSLEQNPSRLTTRGYAFYLWGCEGGGGCGGRRYTSRRFFVQTTDNVYSHAPVTTITSSTAPLNTTGVVTVTFRSNEPGSAFECALNGSGYAACEPPASFGLAVGTNVFSVRAINPFGMIGRAKTVKVTYKPLPGVQ